MSASTQLMNFGLSGVEVICLGVGGATLGSHRNISRNLPDVAALHPYLIFVHVGENDVGRMSDRCVVSNLLNFVSQLSTLCDSGIVIVGQLIVFPRNSHHQSVNHINHQLSNRIHHRNIFWRHRRGFRQSSRRLFLADRIHLNNIGMQRYWRSVRTIVAGVLRRNHPAFQCQLQWLLCRA